MNLKKCLMLGVLFLFFATACSSNDKGEKDKIKYESLSFEDKISNDNIEFSFSNSSFTKAAYLKDYDYNLEEKEDKIYYILFGKVTNKNNVAINFLNNLSKNLEFDEKYKYEVNILPNDLYNIDPLENKDFVIYVSIPQNVVEQTKKYSLKFGFNGDFSNCELDNCEFKYKINGTVDEVGSATNVVNEETFKEYMTKVMKTYDEFGYSDNSYFKIYMKNVSKKVSLGKSDYTVTPQLVYRYSDSENKAYTKVGLEIEINNHNGAAKMNKKDPYYMFVENFEISSSGGKIKLKPNSPELLSHSNYGSIGIYTSTVYFDTLEYDLAKLKKIFTGSDLQMNFKITELHDKDKKVTFKFDDKLINVYKKFFEFDDNIVKNYN